MAKTLNPPKQVTCGNTSQSLDLNNSTVKVIIRNRSGTQAANVNIGYAAPADDTTPQQDGDDAITLFPGDEITLDVPTGADQHVNYINAATSEAPVLEVIEIT